MPGVISALRYGTATDYVVATISYFGIAMPVFLLAPFAQQIFGVWLHWFPTSGTSSYGFYQDPLSSFLDHPQHLFLPLSA